MTAKEYVIARNRGTKEFFTSSSAYDRPRWIPITEATIYHTPELAQAAAIKLAKNGAYECRVVTLEQVKAAMAPVSSTPYAGITSQLVADEENEDTQMVAADQQQPCDVCAHEPCTCDDVSGVEDIVDKKLGESETMPAKPPVDTPSDENKTTAGDKPFEIKTIEYKDPTNKEDKPATDADKVAQDHDEKISVPSNVMAELNKVIKDHEEEAEQCAKSNPNQAHFCRTVASAFTQLKDDLEQGTVAGMKMAQVHLTSYMSPITSLLPTTVMKFIHMGGRKPTLKDLFDTKREQQRMNEAVNHMGDRTQQTYSGWKRACQQAYPGCTFRGDKDICAAVLNGRDVGEWDGAEGSVFKKETKQ